ncbi:helix-turn-helix transcriptional regulator [Mangrovibacter plantisponsor]|uniref:AraC-like DNA-binding protein n=1 Tax=Mangrovibacter plantisponsor TaxID=451513 RepID=A0A317PY64_9ENTR|nr:AraC family transcriptional regulator [Mangrovibacter plantisponsor]PWW08104.1 AraC-like DNA-binding protein [Mangrovibacter plantisponsor]
MSDDRPVYENIPVRPGELFTLRCDNIPHFAGLDVVTHFHLMFEIMWFRRSSGTFTLGNEQFQIKNNTLVFVPALLLHDMQLDAGDNHLRYLLQFESVWLDDLSHTAGSQLYRDARVLVLNEQDAERIDSLFGWCTERMALAGNDDPLFQSLMQSVLLAIFQRLPPVRHAPKRAHTDVLLERLHQIDHSRNYQVTTEEVAAACNWSASWFSRLFKQHFSMSFKSFILLRKINYAVWLLTTTDKNIADIAQQSGFTDSAYFCLKFRHVMKDSPASFRERIRQTAAMGRSNSVYCVQTKTGE